MEGNLNGRQSDPDRTDKLPVLTEDRLLELGVARPRRTPDKPVVAPDSSAASTRHALRLAEQRTRRLELQLRTQGQTLASLIKALNTRIAKLESYIAGRPDGWREMEQALHSKSTRITQLEADLAERIARIAQDIGEPPPDDGAADSSEPGPRLETPESGQGPELVALDPDQSERYGLTSDAVTIGRGAACNIRIDAESVSREHAVIRREASDATIEDRGSTNGVYVNGTRVERAKLADGDEIAIGGSRFRFVCEAATK